MADKEKSFAESAVDAAMSVTFGLFAGACAPVFAGVELSADGEISDETAGRLITGFDADVDGSGSDGDAGNKK